MTRGLFRLWLVASLIWVIMLLPGLWGGTPSPFPAFTSADNVWFETTHHNFDTTSYVYTPDGKPKPRGTHDDLAWGDEEYDHKIGTDETIKLHKLSDEKVWDATYTDLTSPDVSRQSELMGATRFSGVRTPRGPRHIYHEICAAARMGCLEISSVDAWLDLHSARRSVLAWCCARLGFLWLPREGT